MAIMFRGQYQHTIDAKSRVSVPSRFRDQLASRGDNRLILTPALFDACIHVYPYEAWEQLEEKVAQMPQFDPNVVRLRRLYLSAAVDCDIDKQGRLLIPANLRQHAGLKREVVWAGVGNKAELWAHQKWVEATTMSDEDWTELKTKMTEWGL